MASREDLQGWILSALEDLGGSGSVIDIAKHIWLHHEAELKASGDLFFRWQYEMRWAGQKLQLAGKLEKLRSPRIWRLK